MDDQRLFSDRPDVLSYETDVLTTPVRIAGAPVANLYASTSGTDVDWVVKLIDVYPAETPKNPDHGRVSAHGGGRHPARTLPAQPRQTRPIPPGRVELYKFALPNADHVFRPGHRIMVQIQSSWFPLYDRNPQTYVSNIFFAKPGDYRKTTERVMHTPNEASFVELPVVKP